MSLHQRILTFMEEAGRIGLANERTISVNVKSDDSVVTQTDLAISDLFKQSFKAELADGKHWLLDEESCADAKVEDILGRDGIQFILDPVDGTATYALRTGLWGISLAVFTNGKPTHGYIYMPRLQELYVATPEGAEVTYEPFTSQAHVVKLGVPNVTTKDLSFGSMGTGISRYNHWDATIFKSLQPHSLAVALAWMVSGKVKFSFSWPKLWDVAMALAFLPHTGHRMYSYPSGDEMTHLTADNIQHQGPHPWSTITPLLLCLPQDKNTIMAGITDLPQKN